MAHSFGYNTVSSKANESKQVNSKDDISVFIFYVFSTDQKYFEATSWFKHGSFT